MSFYHGPVLFLTGRGLFFLSLQYFPIIMFIINVAWGKSKCILFKYIFFLWPYQGGHLTFLWELINEIINKTNRKRKSKNTQKCSFLNVCCALMFWVSLCCSVCLFLYEAFCHGAHKLDMSTLFTTFYLWISLYILH